MLSPDQIFNVKMNTRKSGVCFVSIRETFNIPHELQGAVWPTPGEGWTETLVEGKRIGDMARASGYKLREMDDASFIVCTAGNPSTAASAEELQKYARTIDCIMYEEAPSELLHTYMAQLLRKRGRATKRVRSNRILG